MSDLKAAYSTIKDEDFPETLTIVLGDEKLVYKKRRWTLPAGEKGLRYGENPDQPAALFQLVEGKISLGGTKWRMAGDALVSALTEAQMIQSGKHPGKTNLTDVDNGANILQYLHEHPAAVILKHNNPSGAGWANRKGESLLDALNKAYMCDRIASFGGAVVVNRPLGKAEAELIQSNYFEVVAAPAYEDGVVGILKNRKNLRIMELPGLGMLENLIESSWLDIKSLCDGGLVVQKSFKSKILHDADFLPATATDREGVEVAARHPDRAELEDLRFAWAVEAGVTSNSVIFARDGGTLAIGTGEQDRVGCVELAIHKARTKFMDAESYRNWGLSIYELKQKAAGNHELAEKLADMEKLAQREKNGLSGSRLVSDGFFPFRDGVDIAAAQGVTAIAQPGGSLRDAEVIMACNEAVPQVAMVFTGQRSFRH